MKGSLLKSPELFSVFWTILIIPVVCISSTPLVLSSLFWLLYGTHQGLSFWFFQVYRLVSRSGKVNHSVGSVFYFVWSSSRYKLTLWFLKITDNFVRLIFPDGFWVVYIPLFVRSIIVIFTYLEFFTSVFPDGLSLEPEWQQVYSSLQESSQYSGRFN